MAKQQIIYYFSSYIYVESFENKEVEQEKNSQSQ